MIELTVKNLEDLKLTLESMLRIGYGIVSVYKEEAGYTIAVMRETSMKLST
jgi:hypothetical protein